MKIIKAKEMGRIEKLAYADGASEEDFMNRAGLGVAEKAQKMLAKKHLKPKITLLCGAGNNAGDAYVAGRVLSEGGFQVHALALASFEKSSPLCQMQSKKFVDAGGRIEYIQNGTAISFADTQLLIDGILGTGFHGEVEGLFKEVIEKANQSKLPILAIDIPSGIDGTTGVVSKTAIMATETLFLGLPKAGCFLKDAWDHVGKIDVYNFGLEAKQIENAAEDYILIEDQMIQNFLPVIKRTRHKYEAGYVVGIGGCKGMPGAPIMSSFAALKSGAGIVRLLHPEGMEAELASTPFEIIREGFSSSDAVLEATQKASAIFIGPGLGTSKEALKILKKVLPNLNKPCVVDAEALTLLAQNDISLPAQAILTPHHGEMKRLLKIAHNISFADLLEMSRVYAFHEKVTLVLKGAPTFIFHPQSKPYVCARGDPGMATAGSGDILTGMIAAFLAQTHDLLKAAILGVQFHAIAGEMAAEKWTSYCMSATNITDALPQVFKNYLKGMERGHFQEP